MNSSEEGNPGPSRAGEVSHISNVSSGTPDPQPRISLAVLAILAIGLLVYGPFARTLGYYWDDWPTVWVYDTFGSAGFTKYFIGSRPVVGWIYAQLFPILGIKPAGWHVLTVLAQCVAAISVFITFYGLWPRRRDVAGLVAVVVLLFPGFTQYPIALSYLPHYVAFALCAMSLAATVHALRAKRISLYLLAASLVFTVASYAITEYFVGLELFRLVLIWYVLQADANPVQSAAKTCRKTLIVWSPFAALWVGFVFWRSFIYRSAGGAHYNVDSEIQVIMQDATHQSLARVASGFYNLLMATVFAWLRPFKPDVLNIDGGLKTELYVLVATLGVVAICAWTFRRPEGRAPSSKSAM